MPKVKTSRAAAKRFKTTETGKILRNNADATSEGDKLSALTQRSFLVCAYGGLIEPISSGQEE